MAVPSQMRSILQPISQHVKDMNFAEIAMVLGTLIEGMVEKYGREKTKEMLQSAVNTL